VSNVVYEGIAPTPLDEFKIEQITNDLTKEVTDILNEAEAFGVDPAGWGSKVDVQFKYGVLQQVKRETSSQDKDKIMRYIEFLQEDIKKFKKAKVARSMANKMFQSW
jgi:hypothetical protein